MKDMPLNKDQSPLLKLFYKKKEIYVSDFEKYGMDENSQTFLSIRSAGYIKVGISYATRVYEHSDIFNTTRISYIITDKGKSAYEEYRREYWKIKKENVSLFFSFVAIVVSVIALIINAS